MYKNIVALINDRQTDRLLIPIEIQNIKILIKK